MGFDTVSLSRPTTATRRGSVTPRRTASSTAARADVTNCVTYVSLASTPASASPMMGREGPSNRAFGRSLFRST